MSDSGNPSATLPPDWRSMFDWAVDETDKVEARLSDAFGDRVFNFALMIGLLPNGTTRISTELRLQSVQDTVAVVHASRVFCDAMGSYLLLRKGLWTQAITLARSTLESVAQSVAFLRDANMAQLWSNGRRFTPGAIRKSLGAMPDFGPLYDALSAIAHANPEATWSHAVPVEGQGFAISYGGSYQPKRGAQLLAVVVELVSIYLHEFYAHYSGRLAIANWPLMIEMGHAMNKNLRDWIEQLPDDWLELKEHVQTLKNEPMPPSPINAEDALRYAEQARARRLGLAGRDSPAPTANNNDVQPPLC
jgi:hypothetical protein